MESKKPEKLKQLNFYSADLEDLLVAFVDPTFFLTTNNLIKNNRFTKIEIAVKGINKAKKTIPAKDSAPVFPRTKLKAMKPITRKKFNLIKRFSIFFTFTSFS